MKVMSAIATSALVAAAGSLLFVTAALAAPKHQPRVPIDGGDGGSFGKVFHKPKIGKKLADGCYSWPGPCRSREQANAFCKRKGYGTAYEWNTSNKVGIFKTKRLGDGGTCIASCTVLTYVECR